MNSENGIQMSRPKTLRRLNLESVHDLPRPNFQAGESASMSPMTNLVRNMSGTSLDSTPKRRFTVNLGRFDGEDQSISGLVGSGVTSAASSSVIADIRDDKLPSSDKENSYATAGGSYLASLSPDKSLTKIAATDGGFLNSPKVRRPALSTLDVNSPIKTGFIKPAPPSTLCGISAVRLPSIEDADSQDSGCYPEDSKYFKYPEPMSSLRRSVSDRFNVSSTASARSSSSSNCSTGGSQRYSGGAAKLDFSFSSSGEDEGIPMDEFDDDAIQPIPTSSTVSRLFATPLSEKANKQFSGHDESFDRMSDSPAGLIIRMPDLSKLSDSTEKSCRPQLRRAWSMYENTTPNSRPSPSITSCSSPLDASPSRGLFPVYDEDPGSSPVAPLGLHVARIRMKPYDQRVIQPVGGPASKRSEPASSCDSSSAQENKRRKDDHDERSLTTQSENNVTATCNKFVSCRGQNRIQRCHSETEATIMRALQRSTEEPDLIGDFTRPFVLPLTRGKHQDLKSISPQTLVDLLEGRFQHLVENFTVVDCRYPYEYDYGHVRDAVNLWTKDMVWNRFMEGRKAISTSTNGDAGHGSDRKRTIIVFHCEFSSERGPSLSRYLRNKDRDDNKDNYPALHWPEVYLLEGGYKAFYENFQEWCDPCGYRPMNEPGHEEDLRRCRAKTKSCQGDGKQGRPLTKSTSRRLALH